MEIEKPQCIPNRGSLNGEYMLILTIVKAILIMVILVVIVMVIKEIRHVKRLRKELDDIAWERKDRNE